MGDPGVPAEVTLVSLRLSSFSGSLTEVRIPSAERLYRRRPIPTRRSYTPVVDLREGT